MAIRPVSILGVLLVAVLSLPAGAQTEPIAWHTSIDTAKAEAKATGRLVLVHFWTEDCAPCVALERNVFTQPEVAAALQQQFVPVKLNANANPATASMMGVTRVPTDVVITPEGDVVGKLISPSTPMAYVAELTQMATRYAGQPGQAMDGAVAAAPQPSQLPASNASASSVPKINSVYAGLQLGPAAPPATPAANSTGQALSSSGQRPLDNRYAMGGPFAAPALPNQAVATQPAAPTAGATNFGAPVAGSIQPSPATIDNRYSATAPARMAPSLNQSAVGQPAVTNLYAGANPPAATTTGPSQPAANFAAAQAAAPDPRQLPAGAPPLGFEGYCPVTMRNEWRWAAGNPQFGAIHRGRTYWFIGAAQQQQFLANPDFYAPALSGIDPVMAIDHRQQVPGRREHSIDYDNLFYLFANEASLQQFTANPERYASSVRAAMGIQRPRTVR
jgi:protein disulfide-isomerase